ncbi:MAG TPA: C-terminal binding protein [Sedimentibacter sp.]|jgi:D-3-phosphoglycerate dehydrogenase|nr:C-terminal binding protein [Sedimentibacter sp.]HOW23408.1 C-terminal binding protein [Sedimentibacter sp.]
MAFKVAMADTIYPDFEVEKKVLAEINAELVLSPSKNPEDIIETAKDADALVVTYAKIPREIIEKLEKCKIIVRTGIGFDNIDLKAASEKGIYVANVPDYCWDEVSDHAMTLILALQRKIMILDKVVKSGNWGLSAAEPILGLRGQTLGLIGFGNIPKALAKKAQVFGFNVIASDPFVTQEVADAYNVKMVDQEELIRTADVISLHAPLIDETYHLANDEFFNKMKKSAFLVNTARGPLVDEEALYRALKENKIAGAALDVMNSEPPAKDNPLLTLDDANLILTPHAAFYSEASSINLRKLSYEEVVRVLKGNAPKNCVNRKMLNK